MADSVNLTTAQLDELRKQVEDHRQEALTARLDWPSRHAQHYRRYIADPSLRPEGPWPDAPRLFVPMTRDVHEKLLSEIWAVLFGNSENILMSPTNEEDVDSAVLASRFLRWSLRSVVDQQWWASESYTALFDALLDSASVCKVVAWEPPWEMPGESGRFFDRVVRIDALDIGTLLIPPDATGMQYPKARYIGQEFRPALDDLHRMRALRDTDGKRSFDIPDPDQVTLSDAIPTERQQAEMEREGRASQPFFPDTALFVEKYERFRIDKRSKFQEDVIVSYFPESQAGDGTKNAKGFISNVRRLIEVFPQDDRPRRPFFETTVWPQPRQWSGLNVPDRLESMQDLVNRLHEQLVAYGEVSMLPYVFASTFLTGDMPDLRQVRPGSTVPIEDINGIQFAPTRSLNRHFAEQIAMAMANIERDSAVSDFTQGRTPDRPNVPRTASATLALLQESRKAFGAMAQHAAVQFQRMLTFYFRLWQSVLPAEFRAPLTPAAEVQDVGRRDVLQRLFGGELTGRFVSRQTRREELSGFFDAELVINPDAAFDRQVLTNLVSLVLPNVQGYTLGQRELLKRVWEAFNQRGFEQIWPEAVAARDTRIQLLAKSVQLEALRGQIAAAQQQGEQAEAQSAQQELFQPSASGETEAPVATQILQQLQSANGEGR